MAEESAEESTPEPAAARWLVWLDFDKPQTTLWGVRIFLLAWAVMAVVAVSWLRSTVSPLTKRWQATPLGGEEHEGHRYGLLLEKRKAIFAELAAAEIAERKRATEANAWLGHMWSREDDRGHQELSLARSLALKHNVSLSVVYMILDEGIRKKWPAPDGNPLPATTPPQDPRSTW
jgi:hypothetical protein